MTQKNIVILLFIIIFPQLLLSQNKCEKLIPAVKSNDLSQLTELINNGANVNQVDEYGATPIMWATFNNNIEMVKFLISRNADLELRGTIYDEELDQDYGSLLAITCAKGYMELTKYFLEDLKLDINQKEYSKHYKSDTGWTPLLWAAYNNNEQLIDYLLTKGADPNIADINGYIALHLAIVENNIQLIEKLIKKNANINTCVPTYNENYGGFYPIHFASIVDSADKIIKILINNGADINKQIIDTAFYGGFTPIHLSILDKNINSFNSLIKYGANINIKNSDGSSPLLYAIDYEAVDFANILIQNNADVNIADNKSMTPLILASKNNFELDFYKKLINNKANLNATIADTAADWNDPGFSALHFACSDYDKIELAKLLVKSGADINIKDVHSYTPLHIACANNNYNLIKFLIENGAAINDKDIDGLTPLHFSCIYSKSSEIPELLVKNGASINVKNTEGWTPIMAAALYGNTETIKYLMDNNADIELKNDLDDRFWEITRLDGSNILFDFIKEGDYKMVKFLVNNGANINAQNDRGETPLILSKEYEHKKIERFLKRKGAKISNKS